MRTSKSAINILKEHEGIKLNAYLCPAGVATIGFGTTQGVKLGQVISMDQAEALLQNDLKRFEQYVLSGVKVPLTQNQFDALVSLIYNIGPGNFKSSTVLRMINEKNLEGIKTSWILWNKIRVKGELVVSPGLVKRRKSELELFLKP